MKKTALFFSLPALLTIFPLETAAQPALPAETLYRNGQYAQALAAYEQQLKHYPNDPYLYYNIGNCYFKMGSNGLAIANYYRAFKRAPHHTDIRHNLALALSAGGERLVPAGVPPAVHRAWFAVSLAQLQGMLCALGWLVCFLIGLWLLTRKGGKLTIAAGILFVLCAGWFYTRHAWETQPLAVVAAPRAELRSGPGTNFPANASIAQGHLVEVLDQKDTWQEVAVNAQGLKGWVEASTLERI